MKVLSSSCHCPDRRGDRLLQLRSERNAPLSSVLYCELPPWKYRLSLRTVLLQWVIRSRILRCHPFFIHLLFPRCFTPYDSIHFGSQ